MNNSRILSESEVQAYEQDGAVCVRGLFSAGELATIERGIERNLAQPGALGQVASGSDDPGRFFEDFCNWQRIPEYETIIRTSRIAQVAGELMRSHRVRFYHDHLLVKEPGTRQRTPWHQDQPYYNVDGRQNVSVWIPVDPVPAASTLKFVAGSHRGPWYVPLSFRDSQAKWFQPGELQDLPDVDGHPGDFRVLGWELAPGDAVCFHMLALHASEGVGGTHRRRVLSLRFLGDDARHAPRRWRTSPEFPGLDRELPPGAPMEHPLFPVVWTADGRG